MYSDFLMKQGRCHQKRFPLWGNFKDFMSDRPNPPSEHNTRAFFFIIPSHAALKGALISVGVSSWTHWMIPTSVIYTIKETTNIPATLLIRFIWFLFQMNQLSLSIESAYTLANQTESAFMSFRNNTEHSFISVSTHKKGD